MNKNILTLFKNFSIYTIKYILNSVFVLEMILLTAIVYIAKDMSDINSIFRIAIFPFVLLVVHIIGCKFLKINMNRVVLWIYLFILKLIVSFNIINCILESNSISLYLIIYDLIVLIFINIFICLEVLMVKEWCFWVN